MKLYNLIYRYNDETSEYEEVTSLMVAYDVTTPAGATLEYALDKASEDGDYSGVDGLLTKAFKVTDDAIMFYYEMPLTAEVVKADVERDLDIKIETMEEIGHYE